ncbi:hypothetical protein ANCCEY_13156 [Ancylostoma ceylanicum]|uniref:Uncharacterized protein n=1 Tax=Ancylostoma ceylanicum TaxID=53326 RepID=A0A0D6LJF7_9BILA|nr:hypothetical protein ANCCEY_13156 [Ancylostoma ceylanicum]
MQGGRALRGRRRAEEPVPSLSPGQMPPSQHESARVKSTTRLTCDSAQASSQRQERAKSEIA